MSDDRHFAPLSLLNTDRLTVKLSSEGHFSIQMWGENGRIASYSAQKFHLRFPEKRKTQSLNTYLVPVTDSSAKIITRAWPESQRFIEEDAQIAIDYLLATDTVEANNAARVANLMAGQQDDYSDIVVHDEYPLSQYQLVGCKNSMSSEGYALFMEQGTGKTPVVITRVCNESPKTKHLYKVLIVCPNNVRQNWVNEFEKFKTCHGRATVLRGGQMKRVKTLIEAVRPANEDQFSAVVCGYETAANMVGQFSAIEWDLIVTDEGHYMKNPSTKRAKAMLKLRDKSKARMSLTGTPITNSAMDLYMQFEFLQKGGSGFSSFENFRRFYGVWKSIDEDGHKKLIGMQNLPLMQERLCNKAFIITKKFALPDLPDKVHDTYEVEMTKDQADVYATVSEDLIAEIEDELENSENKTLLVNNILVKLLRLAEITSGYVKFDEIRDIETGEVLRPALIDRFDPNPKIDALIELIGELGENSKMIVWANFTQNIKSISAALRVHGIKHVTFTGSTSDAQRLQAEHDFNNDPECRVFVGNPAAGGTGLNLLGYPPGKPEESEMNADHVVYYSQDWSSTNRSQSEDRAHRRGTRNPVRITDLCVPNTIDEEIRARVLNKRIHALEVSDVRGILTRIIEQ